MNSYHVDNPFNQLTLIPGYHIQHAMQSFLQLYGTVYQETISIFKLSFPLSKKNTLFSSQQAKLVPSVKV